MDGIVTGNAVFKINILLKERRIMLFKDFHFNPFIGIDDSYDKNKKQYVLLSIAGEYP